MFQCIKCGEVKELEIIFDQLPNTGISQNPSIDIRFVNDKSPGFIRSPHNIHIICGSPVELS